MQYYKKESKLLVAVDCIIFGFNGESIDILLIKRGFEPEIGKWSLMGGFVQPDESPELSAARVLKDLTGIEHVFMDQCGVFGNPARETEERVISIVYYALVDKQKYQNNPNDQYESQWFALKEIPNLIFDHHDMIDQAIRELQTKAALYPILFKLLPEKFTIPQIAIIYENVYQITFDKRNFSRKLNASGILIKLNEKDKENSKRGAFYYRINKDLYKEKVMSFIRHLPSWTID